MNIAILSDIHGYSTALEAVLKDAEQYNIDKYLILGDYFDVGPQPVEVYQIIKELDYLAIKGNHDNDLLLYSKGNHLHWNDCCLFDSLLWTYSKLTKEMLNYIDEMVDDLIYEPKKSIKIYLNHIPLEKICEKAENITSNHTINFSLKANEQITINGHTHNAYYTKSEAAHYINPGSVGVSYNKYAQYTIMTIKKNDINVTYRNIPYDIDVVEQAFINNGLLSDGGIQLSLKTMKTGIMYYSVFKRYAIEYAKKLGFRLAEDIPNEVWIKAYDEWSQIVN